MLDDVSHMLLSAGVKAGSGRIEVIARKVAIGLFGASWKVSWSSVDILAATVVRVRHDGQQVARCNLCSLFERSESLCIEILLVINYS